MRAYLIEDGDHTRIFVDPNGGGSGEIHPDDIVKIVAKELFKDLNESADAWAKHAVATELNVYGDCLIALNIKSKAEVTIS